MKKQRTKHTYLAYKHLKGEKEDMEERIEEYNSKRGKIMWLIKDEKENYPSEEILLFDETFDKVLPGLKLEIPENNYSNLKACKYHSKGFWKHGSSCQFFHSKHDCKDHLFGGGCLNSGCQHRHRQEC